MYMKIFRITIFLITSGFFCQNSYSSIHKADSLFFQKKYTESKVIYDSIFYKENKFSNSMLLKMASIEEIFDNYEKSIYYLELFQKNKNEKEVLDKINDIVTDKKLIGFESNEKKKFINFYKKNKKNILILLLIFIVIIFLINAIRFFNKKDISFLIPHFYILCIIAIVIINIKPPVEAIVFKENTFVMKEPSSGSDLYSILNKGDKLIVSKNLEVWYEIILNNEKKYVRKKNIRLID